MRSERAGDGQPCLPLDLPPAPPAPAPVRRPRAARADDRLHHRLSVDTLASRGLPAGTEVAVRPGGRRPLRGDLVLARSGEQAVVGVYDVRFGRPVLRWDRGGMWLGPAWDVVGVVTAAEPPLVAAPTFTDPSPVAQPRVVPDL